MTKNIFKTIIVILCVTVIILLMINYRPFLRIFKKEENLIYNNVSYISIKLGIDKPLVNINDTNDVEKIVDYINSLELVEEKIPRNENNDYHEDYEAYKKRLKNNGYFSITIFEHSNGSDDSITFSTEYLTIHRNGYDWDYTSYYIKNSGYNPEDKTSNFYNFISELVSKYTEE